MALQFPLQNGPAALLGGLADLELRQTGKLAIESQHGLVDRNVGRVAESTCEAAWLDAGT